MPRTSDKRERLIAAAKDLIHQQGYNQTSLADIAENSGVPLGNVYYYFRTKDDIAAAVISEHESFVKGMLKGFEEESADPVTRLNLMMDFVLSRRDKTAEHGCPVGSLCQELDKNRSNLSQQADAILALQVAWSAQQFELMGRADSQDLGQYFVASVAGAALLASALNDQSVVENQVKQLRIWLNQT